MKTVRDAEVHHLIGGILCLDFANTLYGHGENPVHEYLFDYRDLALWSRHAGILANGKIKELLDRAEEKPREAASVFRRAVELREAMFRLFAALAHGRNMPKDDLDLLHTTWTEGLKHSRLVRNGAGFILDWADDGAPDSMLWRIADSAIRLLTSNELSHVKQCNRCDWLFVDRSRNHQRRWCSMSACGNRVKMSRRYARRKQGKKKTR